MARMVDIDSLSVAELQDIIDEREQEYTHRTTISDDLISVSDLVHELLNYDNMYTSKQEILDLINVDIAKGTEVLLDTNQEYCYIESEDLEVSIEEIEYYLVTPYEKIS